MGLAVKKCSALFLALIILCPNFPVYAAENQSVNTDNNIYEVLARSNMRAEPSLEGAWMMTIPQGVTVKCIGTDAQEFSKIEYEGVTGYIYSGCIRKIENIQNISEESEICTLDDRTEAAALASNEGMYMGNSLGIGRMVNSLSASEEMPAAAITQIKVLTNANVRGTPSIEGRWLNTVPKDTMVTLLDEGSNGFTHISYQGQEGYIYSKLLDVGEETRAASGISSIVITPEMQNTQEKGESAVILQALQRGVLRNSNEISTQISVEVENVAATSNMIEVQTIISSASQAEAAARAAGLASDNMAYEISNRANMRVSPSAESSWMATLPVGADIIRLGETTDGYTMVQYDGMVGYVLEDCISSRGDISRLGSEPVLFVVTAYCSCRLCCGNYSPEVTGREARTSTGTVPRQGRTVAVDPTVIPYGTSLHIDGMGDYIAEDCGGGIRQNHIDIYFDTHEAAVLFGTKRLYVTINH